jgi:hypothetical protein
VVLACLKVKCGLSPEETEKKHENLRIARKMEQIQTGCLQAARVDRYCRMDSNRGFELLAAKFPSELVSLFIYVDNLF